MADLSGFLSELASESPTPGGGSVAALAGSLGAALNSMVCNLTIGKKKYAEVESEMEELLGKAESLRLELARLIDEDAAAFDKFMDAMKLPKETDGDKAKRRDAMQSALVDAATVPLAVMEKCVEVASLARDAAAKGNRNAVSDAGVAVLMARAGAHAARLNVIINLGSISAPEHKAFVDMASEAVQTLAADADSYADEVMSVVETKLAG
ncbi:MAG: methenyltetrahydrofolate cyclohydrolase [Candidatus Eisenbacteria bacterium]|nr:methenyltetrahydrofolate cyclohydrolase [Candidatus Eisenbacteria bacterium]